MPFDIVRGFTSLNTAKNPKHLQPNQISFSLNLEWISDEEVYVRRGCRLRKNNTQWVGAYVIDGATFKRRNDTTYKEIVFLNNGKIFYIDSASYVDENSTYTEILSNAQVSPALTAGLRKVSFDAINNKFFVVDGSSNIYSWDTTLNYLTLVPDPSDFTITATILNSVNATVGDIYKDGAISTNRYYVKVEKVAADGVLTLSIRQTAGNTRLASSGTLTKVTGAGDSSIVYTAIEYSNTYEEYKLYQRRGNAVTNEGLVFVSTSRNGDNFTGAGAGFLEFDLIEGLKVSNFLPYKNGAVITTEDIVTEKFSLSTLTGYKFFSASVAGSEVGQFKIERESKIHGIVGRSGQEIGNIVVGLTRNGFISFSGTSATQLGITDQSTLSNPIKDQIEKINFAQSDKIISAIDTDNQRYLCAVPTYENDFADTIFVFDYGKTTDEPKWSIWSMGFGNIAGLFVLKNKLHVADTEGNYHEMMIDNLYTDNESPYTVRFESAAFGANSSVLAKKYDSVSVDFSVPNVEQTITMYSKLDGKIIRETPQGRAVNNIILEPATGGGDVISDLSFIDSVTFIGSDSVGEQQVKHNRLAGKALVGQIGITSSSAGVNWGITGLMLEYKEAGSARGQ